MARASSSPTATRTPPARASARGVPQAGALHGSLVQPSLLSRLEEVLSAEHYPMKVNLSKGCRFVTALVDVELFDYLNREAVRMNGLKAAGRLTGRASAHSLALVALSSRLPSLHFYQQFLAKVQDRRQAIGAHPMSLRVPTKIFADLEALHQTLSANDNKLISVKGIAEALIFAWATALKEENPFTPGGKSGATRGTSASLHSKPPAARHARPRR